MFGVVGSESATHLWGKGVAGVEKSDSCRERFRHELCFASTLVPEMVDCCRFSSADFLGGW